MAGACDQLGLPSQQSARVDLFVQNIFNTGTEDGALDKGNFSKLDNLIVQTGHYSAFLFEQMKASLYPTFSYSNKPTATRSQGN